MKKLSKNIKMLQVCSSGLWLYDLILDTCGTCFGRCVVVEHYDCDYGGPSIHKPYSSRAPVYAIPEEPQCETTVRPLSADDARPVPSLRACWCSDRAFDETVDLPPDTVCMGPFSQRLLLLYLYYWHWDMDQDLGLCLPSASAALLCDKTKVFASNRVYA